mmetsp:Transcript_18686/g.49375  ORF Transcript_18686/g.49375 Transcript_18686/m.49375 type:complete len:326 (+) Transcript_18686:794-1771(+)
MRGASPDLILRDAAGAKHGGVEPHLNGLLTVEHGPRRNGAHAIDVPDQAPHTDQFHLRLLHEALGQLLVHHSDRAIRIRLARWASPTSTSSGAAASTAIGVCRPVARVRHAGVGPPQAACLLVFLFSFHLHLELVEPGCLATLRGDVLPHGQRQGPRLTRLGGLLGRAGCAAAFFVHLVQPRVVPDRHIASQALLVPLLVHAQQMEDLVCQRRVTDLVRVPGLEQAAHHSLVVVRRHAAHLSEVLLDLRDVLRQAGGLGLGGLVLVAGGRLGEVLLVGHTRDGDQDQCRGRRSLLLRASAVDLVHLEMLARLVRVSRNLHEVGPL